MLHTGLSPPAPRGKDLPLHFLSKELPGLTDAEGPTENRQSYGTWPLAKKTSRQAMPSPNKFPTVANVFVQWQQTKYLKELQFKARQGQNSVLWGPLFPAGTVLLPGPWNCKRNPQRVCVCV